MILLTGGSGFVGSAVQRALTKRAIPYRLYEGEIRDFQKLREQLAGVETVIHLAGGEARGRVRYLRRVDLDGTAALVKALRFHSVRRVIYLSRLNADPHALFPLLRTKGRCEQLVRNSGFGYTIVRSATLFGRDDRFTNAIATTAGWSWPIVWIPGGGINVMQPLWVEDLARCLVDAIGQPALRNQTIELAGAERYRYLEIVNMVLAAAHLSRWPFYARPLLARSVNRMTTWMFRRPMLNRYDHDRFSTNELTELDVVVRQFGFQPARMHDHLAHLRRRGLYLWLFRG